MATKIENLIRETANKSLNGKYNLAQYKEGGKCYNERLLAETHKQVCEQVVEFADAHPAIPMYIILQVGISKGAYQQRNFDKGYRTFDAEKVETVYNMCKRYNEYHGIKGKPNDICTRLVMSFYERVSEELDDFETFLTHSEVLGKRAVSRDVDYFVLQRNLGVVMSDLPLTAKQKAIRQAQRDKEHAAWEKQQAKRA